MGLLDQVLGQVIGGMMGGGSPAPGGRSGQDRTGPSGGGLGDLLGGARSGQYSPLIMALLAILASKHLGSGAGGYGSVLHDLFGRMTGGGGPGRSREAPGGGDGSEMAEGYGDPPGYDGHGSGGEFGYDERPPPRGRSGGGRDDFLDSVGSMLDGPGGTARHAASFGKEPELDQVVGSGFDGLLDQFRHSGRSDLVESWIGPGANRPASPEDIEQALGSRTVSELSRSTGLDRDELLSQLSRALPELVDGLTPGGRLPTPDERRGWI